MTKVQEKLLNPKKVKMSQTKAFVLLTVAAFVGAFASFFFVIAAHIFAPGLAGISNGFAYAINDIILWQTGSVDWAGTREAADTIIYWIFYLVASAPIIYLTVVWFSKRFVKYSLYFLITNLIFSMIFAFIPGTKDGIVELDTLSETGKMIGTMVMASIGGILSGISVGLAFKVGACTMGLDPVAKKVSRDKDINIAVILMYIAVVNTTLWTIILSLIPEPTPLATDTDFIKSTLLSPEYIGSWIYIGSYSFVAGYVYSSNKKVEVFTTSEHTDKISDYFNSISYHRGHTIYTLEGGYTHKERKAIKMIVNFDEMYEVVEKVAALDSKAFITVKELYRVYDIHNWITMTDEDKEKEKTRLNKEAKKREKNTNFSNNKKC